MTVGDKIRYIRNLRNLTQKELGIKSGFSSSTSDVRIRQYESNKMVPKADKLSEIASSLNVDISALSDINITSVEDILHVLFELEESNGLTIDKVNDNYILSFDKSVVKRDLLYALDSWYEAKQKFIQLSSDYNDEKVQKDYLIWKMRYPLDIKANELEQSAHVQSKYLELEQTVKEEKLEIVTFKDIITIFEEMLKSGIEIEFYTEHIGVGQGLGIFCFHNSQLLSLEKPISVYYANFLYAIKKLSEYGIIVQQGSHSFENDTFTEYYIYSSQISTMILTLEKLQQWIKEDSLDDLEHLYEYKDALKWMNVPIKEYV